MGVAVAVRAPVAPLVVSAQPVALAHVVMAVAMTVMLPGMI